jgi:hypothetical protein
MPALDCCSRSASRGIDHASDGARSLRMITFLSRRAGPPIQTLPRHPPRRVKILHAEGERDKARSMERSSTACACACVASVRRMGVSLSRIMAGSPLRRIDPDQGAVPASHHIARQQCPARRHRRQTDLGVEPGAPRHPGPAAGADLRNGMVDDHLAAHRQNALQGRLLNEGERFAGAAPI